MMDSCAGGKRALIDEFNARDRVFTGDGFEFTEWILCEFGVSPSKRAAGNLLKDNDIYWGNQIESRRATGVTVLSRTVIIFSYANTEKGERIRRSLYREESIGNDRGEKA